MKLIGVDVGFSRTRRSTGVACLEDEALYLWRAGSDWKSRKARIPRDFLAETIALDGPLVPENADELVHRTCESMFSRAPFHNRCKPGLSHFGTGLNLRRAAAEARAQFGQVLASGTTANAVSGAENAIVEAFPNAFLGVLLPDRDFGTAPKLRRGERFDWLYARIVMGGKLQKILSTELKLPDIVWQRLKEESDHELRAALICLLTAALAHRGMAHVVGNEETGWFWLPPKRVWQSWAIKGLTQSGSKNKAFEPIRSDSPLLQERVLVKEIKILKGNRITIPREVRESLAVKQGDKIRITVQGKVMVLTKPKQRDGNRRS